MKRIVLIAIALLPLVILAQTKEECYTKGENYQYGRNGVSKDYNEALKWYLKAAEQGHVLAQQILGYSYENGCGVTKDYIEAAKWYRKAAEQGFRTSQYCLGYMYANGCGVAKDYAEAAKWYRKAAEQGYDIAQWILGTMYEMGEGIAIDHTEAVKWYRKAADQGLSNAQYDLGIMYEEGLGVNKDYNEAVRWYRKAAEKNRDYAQCHLGTMYEQGLGVNKDYAEAAKWYRKAAEQGYEKAQFKLGLLYENGYGVNKDYYEAVKWYRKAAEQGYANGQNQLGIMYQNGNGVTKDYKLAIEWYQKAAAQGSPSAMINIGILYEMGYGVPQNFQTAKEWYQEAIRQNPNYASAKNNLANIEKKIAGQGNHNNLIADVDKDIPKGSKNENLFAVIIGNEKYENEQDVPFAENDARIFREYCSKTLGMNDKHILFFTNAGYNNINIAIHWLKTHMEAYDGDACAIFYYAGHGIPDESSKEAYLLPVDGKGSMLASAYSLKMLNDELSKISARTITVFLDACFSGANRDGQQMATTRGIALKVNETKPQGKVILFSAAQSDQTASPYKEQNHGLFTYFLLRKLKETKGDVTLGELSDYLIRQVKRASVDVNNRIQSPTTQASNLLSKTWQNMKLR